MRRQKVMILSSITGLFLWFGCSENAVQPQSSNQGTIEYSYFVTEAMAREIAQTAVDSQYTDYGWNRSSKVTDVFPIYISGIEGVSYWECKIETNGSPTGYVLVTANKADVLVPELSQTGLTLTEQYREKTGTNDIAVHRYDWSHSAAFPTAEVGLSKRSSTHALMTIGFENDFQQAGLGKTASDSTALTDIDVFEATYYTHAQSSGCMPRYSKDFIEEYYAELVSDDSAAGLSKSAADWRNQSGELKNWCPTPIADPWHTVQWNQFKKDNGNWVGCGPVAWAIVFAYWDAFKGTSGLFGDTCNAYNYSARWSETKTSIKSAISSIAKHLGTWDKTGLTLPSRMEDGWKYANDCGYPATWVVKHNGTEYEKFDKAKRALDANRPCMLLIHSDGIGIVDHYVVIEKARKSQTKYLWNWHDRNVYYKVNYGWGDTWKEICVRDWGGNQNGVYTATSLYDAYIQKNPNVYPQL